MSDSKPVGSDVSYDMTQHVASQHADSSRSFSNTLKLAPSFGCFFESPSTSLERRYLNGAGMALIGRGSLGRRVSGFSECKKNTKTDNVDRYRCAAVAEGMRVKRLSRTSERDSETVERARGRRPSPAKFAEIENRADRSHRGSCRGETLGSPGSSQLTIIASYRGAAT